MQFFSFSAVCISFGLYCNPQHAHFWGHRVLTHQSIKSLWSRTIYLQHHFFLFYHENKMLQKIVLKHTINLQTLNCPSDLAIFLVHTGWHLHIWGFIRGFSNVLFWIPCVHQNIWEPCKRPCSSGSDPYLSKVRKELVVDCLKISSKYMFWVCGEHTKCHPQTRSQCLFVG